jgi:hypothetical protein
MMNVERMSAKAFEQTNRAEAFEQKNHVQIGNLFCYRFLEEICSIRQLL